MSHSECAPRYGMVCRANYPKDSACTTYGGKASCLHRLALPELSKETVNHPQHYGGDTIYETIKVLKAWLTPEQYQGFLIGNAIKYQSRCRNKGGVEDIKKALWYLNKYMEEFPQ